MRKWFFLQDLPTVVLPPPIGDEFDPEKAMEEERARAEKAAKASSPENVINEVERANNHTEDEAKDDPELTKLQEEEKGEVEEEEEEKLVKKPKDAVIEKGLKEVAGGRMPVDFPLYAIHSGRSDAVHMPCGQLPLLCFWVKRERPRQLSKMTGILVHCNWLYHL